MTNITDFGMQPSNSLASRLVTVVTCLCLHGLLYKSLSIIFLTMETKLYILMLSRLIESLQ